MQTDSERSTPPGTHPKHQPNEVQPLVPSHALTTLTISHSVLGIIAIPGMMTGAILGGSSVEQAARLQMVIMFMISSCTALSSIVTTILALGVIVDNEHRVRADRIDVRPHAVWRARNALVAKVVERAKAVGDQVRTKARPALTRMDSSYRSGRSYQEPDSPLVERGERSDRQRLLPGGGQ